MENTTLTAGQKFAKLIDLRMNEFNEDQKIVALSLKFKLLQGQRLDHVESNFFRANFICYN